jgi:serine/threonine protein kinase
MAARIEAHAEPIPGYRLIERLGGGGFGEVWKCEAPGGLFKAIKFVYGDLAAAGEDDQRATQELKALSRVKTVRHPYVLSLERYDIIDGQLLIVMELADRNLWDRFKECRAQGLPGIPRPELLGYVEETAEALDLMNGEYQLQHLDIKPQNLFLVHNHVKVADFGLVKALEGMQASVTGGVTPVYAAPETFDGWVSRFCDQYSLAIVYQELLTGQRPFVGNNVRHLIVQHLQSPPNVSSLPAAEQPIIARALAKTPDERFPTCLDLVRALREAATVGPRGDAVAPSTRPGADTNTPGSPPGVAPPIGVMAVRDTAEALTPLDLRGEGSDTGESGPHTTCIIRALPGSACRLKTEEEQTPRAAPEVRGDGCLFPAVVVGIGQLGLTVLQRLREDIAVRFGGPESLPNLRLLLLDTDPEVVRSATKGRGGARLSETEVLLAPLGRPSHYLKPRDGRPQLDTWLNPRMLYRIPRSQVTAGVRALGRLAFCDNYRVIRRRLRNELEACLDLEALTAAGRQTGLGLRTSRPRVYLVASLAGGTGSGMFLDLAYVTRALLRQMGHEQPDVVGLFLLPRVDRNRTRTLPLGNACAALRELSHFASPGTCFTARYQEREEPTRDGDPPFGRCFLLPLPEETDEQGLSEVTGLAGQFLARDLCSPLGRASDLARAGLSGPAWERRGLYYQTFGLFQVSWPQRTLFQEVGRQLCQRLVQRWMSKDSKPIREAVQAWVQEQWTHQEMDGRTFLARLADACQETLGKPTEEVFGAILARRVPASAVPVAATGEGPGGRGRGSGVTGRKGAPPAPEVPAEDVAAVLEEFEQLLGTPPEDSSLEPSGRLVLAMREAADRMVHVWGQKLAELPVHLIEEPDYRLAGAEEAIRQMVASVEQLLQHHEPLSRELSTRAADAHARLEAYAAPARPAGSSARSTTLLAGRSATATGEAPPTAAEVLELLRNYPKWRLQSLLMRQAANAFVTLRGHLADEMREINFCRVRLGELQRLLADSPHPAAERCAPAEAGSLSPSGGQAAAGDRQLFPSGCKDFKGAVAHFLSALEGPETLRELDVRMEAMLKKEFSALVNICLSHTNLLKNVEPAMRQEAAAFVAAQMPLTDVAQMFLEHYRDEEAAAGEIVSYFEEAAPELSSDRLKGNPFPTEPDGAELCVLATPVGEAGNRFQELARQALPGTDLQMANSPDDILLYRERVNLPLAALEQLGPLAQEAYRQMSATEHFTPHTRIDVDFK